MEIFSNILTIYLHLVTNVQRNLVKQESSSLATDDTVSSAFCNTSESKNISHLFFTSKSRVGVGRIKFTWNTSGLVNNCTRFCCLHILGWVLAGEKVAKWGDH